MVVTKICIPHKYAMWYRRKLLTGTESSEIGTEKGVVNSMGMKDIIIPSFHKHYLNTYYMLQ